MSWRQRGRSARVADEHYSLMGATDPVQMGAICPRTGRSAQARCRGAPVVLSPRLTLCTRAVSALGRCLEEEGIATVAIALIRPQAENTKPPRTLWVPFELGRPFGPPNDPAFQKRVVVSALRLLKQRKRTGHHRGFRR